MHKLVFLIAALLLLPGQAAAQASAASPAMLDDSSKRIIVDSLSRALERYHTSPDTARIIGDVLRRAEQSGRYRGLDTPAFARALTDDLREVNGDKHLGVSTSAPAFGPGPGAQLPPQARLSNYGVRRAEYLEGNIGYLKLAGPMWGTPETLDAVVRGLEYLGNAEALIVDVRGVPGGSAGQVNFIFSHFVPAGTPEVRVINRMSGTDQVRRALDEVPGPRRVDVPLYVLADSRSGSAAEALPFAFQSAGRATIVGENTAGAGRNVTFVELGGGLWGSVTFTRVSDPRTGREFEGRGVVPDIAVPSAEALDAAYADALRRLGRTLERTTAPAAVGAPAHSTLGTGAADVLPLRSSHSSVHVPPARLPATNTCDA